MPNSIGILGFGLVGKSALKILSKTLNVSSKFYKNLEINLYDRRVLTKFELDLLKKYSVNVYSPIDINDFIKNSEKVFVSPGFKLKELFNNFKDIKPKVLCELDLFLEFFKKKSVAITGSLGKTTVTSFLSNIVGKLPGLDGSLMRVKNAGNIGIAMLDLIEQQDQLDLALLELSSFQLKLNKDYSPDIAILTNFYSNHLDWHVDLKDYFESKCKIFEYQNKNQDFIFNSDLLLGELNCELKKIFVSKLLKTNSKICCITKYFEKTFLELTNIGIKDFIIFYRKDDNFIINKIVNNKIEDSKVIFDLKFLPKVSFDKNWYTILATLFLLDLDLSKLKKVFLSEQSFFSDNSLKFNRLEHFVTINNIDFYNDSKSTVYQATKEAVLRLAQNKRPIVLILGGLSKGVDRKPLIKFLKNIKEVKNVFCFGKDCNNFSCYNVYENLEDTVNSIFNVVKSGDQVLFSPAGSSFDLFKDYKHRGDCFKELVLSRKRCN